MLQRRVKIHEQKEKDFGEIVNREARKILFPITKLYPAKIDGVGESSRIENCVC
jgi:hypothetical protein